MRKIILLITIGAVLVFTGCSSIKHNNTPQLAQQENAAKSCKLEVLSAQDDTLLKTIDDQDAVNKPLNAYSKPQLSRLAG